MRTRLMATLCGILAFVPGAARAQIKQPVQLADPSADNTDAAGQEAPSETEGVEVVDPPQKPPKLAQPGRDEAPGEVHTVIKGDTLWDLSQRYLGSPWYWPKVWSYNPAIANPHWIYPGNAVRFFPAGEEVPSRVEVGEAPNELPSAGEDGLNSVDMIQPEGGEATVSLTAPIGYKSTGARRVIHEAFVTSKELQESGRIDSSFSEMEMLSTFDTVYLQFKQKGSVKLGDRYVIFRTVQEVEHPISGRDVGYLTQFLGTVKIVKTGKGLVTAQIMETWDPIQRGDLVGPFGEKLSSSVSVRNNDRDVKGYVLISLVPFLNVVGEHHTIVVDKGSADGVQAGNTFTVIRQADQGGDIFRPQDVDNDELPVEDVATCMAVDVKEKASTCLLIRSLREVVPGDRVEMRRAAAGGGSSPVSLLR
ncbi:MAG: LysM peptidoglycan-binding domain-containing protein [Myxococcaceae bacterium]